MEIEQQLQNANWTIKLLLLLVIALLVGTFSSFTTINNETTVSWYGPGFHGKQTANGEIYNENALTCASPTLKFNTFIEITNLDNKKSIIVRVNDRGPYKCYIHEGKIRPVRPLEPHPTRTFDLSKAAFGKIADLNKGVIRIKYKIL